MQSVSVTLPQLIQLAKQARDLTFGAKQIKAMQVGQHLSRLFGRGMEFAETRRYQPGDDIRTIDWRVTARTGKTHTKLFAAEKERQILVGVDLRRPMYFATQGVFKSVQAALMAGYIAWNAVHEGNRIGGLIFDETEAEEFRPMRGKRGALTFLQAVAKRVAYTPEKLAQPSLATMDDALKRLERIARPGSLICLLSDFRKPAARMKEALFRLARHSDVVLCLIYDPLEEALPEKQTLPVMNGAKMVELNTFRRKENEAYRLRFAERKEMLKALCCHRHIHFLSCSTEADCLEILRRGNG